MAVALVVAAGIVLLVLPGALRPAGRRLRPREWTVLCILAMAVGPLAVETGLVLRAAPTVLRAAGAPTLAAACHRLLGPLLLGGSTAGWAAFGVALVVPLRWSIAVRRALERRRGARVESWLGEHLDVDGYDLAVVPAAIPVAFGVPGRPGQIVISNAAFETLDSEAAAAVLRHEVAHLRHRHGILLLLAAGVEGALGVMPGVRVSTDALRGAVERWADDEAASAGPVARAALRRALLAITGVAVTSGGIAFSAADGIQERLVALDESAATPPVVGHALLYAPGVAAGGVLLTAIVQWAGHAQTLLAMTGRCPS